MINVSPLWTLQCLSSGPDQMLRQPALTAKRTMTRAGDLNGSLDRGAAIRERPLPRKRFPVLTLPGRVQNMCPAYLARHAWPLALMRSADRVPINFAGFDAPPRFRVFSIPGHEPSIISSVHPSRSVACCLAITPLQQSSNS